MNSGALSPILRILFFRGIIYLSWLMQRESANFEKTVGGASYPAHTCQKLNFSCVISSHEPKDLIPDESVQRVSQCCCRSNAVD